MPASNDSWQTKDGFTATLTFSQHVAVIVATAAVSLGSVYSGPTVDASAGPTCT